MKGVQNPPNKECRLQIHVISFKYLDHLPCKQFCIRNWSTIYMTQFNLNEFYHYSHVMTHNFIISDTNVQYY